MQNLFETPRPAVRRLFANVSWLTADQLFRLGCGLVIGVAIARALGPANFGVLNYATAAAAFSAIIGGVGLDAILQRDLVKAQSHQWNTFLTTSLLLRIVAGIAVFVTYAAIITLGTRDIALRRVCIIMGLTVLFSPLSVFDLWFQSQTLARFSVYARNAAFLTTTVARVTLLLRHQVTVLALTWLAVIEVALAGIVFVIFYRQGGASRHGPWKWDSSLAWRWLGESWTQLASGLAIFVYMRIDQIMLQNMLNSHAVGIYSAAVRISEIGYFIPTMLASTLLPTVVRSQQRNRQEYVERRQHYFDLSALLSVAIALPTTILAPFIVRFLYGNAFAEAASILVVHGWATVFVFTGIARGQYLLTEGLLRFSFYATVVGAVLNVLLNLVLIPRYGGLGAACATLVAYGSSAFVSSFFSRSSRPMGRQQWNSFLLPLAASRLIRAGLP